MILPEQDFATTCKVLRKRRSSGYDYGNPTEYKCTNRQLPSNLHTTSGNSTLSFGIPNGNRTINISKILKDHLDIMSKDKKLKQFKYGNNPLY